MEGLGGFGLLTPVVSYAPRPMFMSISEMFDIIDGRNEGLEMVQKMSEDDGFVGPDEKKRS